MAEELSVEEVQEGGEGVASGWRRTSTGGRSFATGDDNPARKARLERERLAAAVAGELAEPSGEVGDGAGAVLRDMRWAYRNLGRVCRGTAQQESFRVECQADLLKFTADLEKREREFRASKAAAAVAVRAQEAEVSGPGPSAESGVVVRLIDGLLAEIGGDG